MKKIPVIILLCILCSALYGNSQFKLIKKNTHTELYERWIQVNNDQVRELKAVFTVNSNITSVIRLIKSQENGTRWQTKAKKYIVKNTQSAMVWLNYIQYDLPAIMDDQDCLLMYTMHTPEKDPADYCEIEFASTTDSQFPVTEKIKRITGIRGSWKMEKQNNTSLKITYTISSNRDKTIPRFVSDPIIRDNLMKTMDNFKKQLELYKP